MKRKDWLHDKNISPQSWHVDCYGWGWFFIIVDLHHTRGFVYIVKHKENKYSRWNEKCSGIVHNKMQPRTTVHVRAYSMHGAWSCNLIWLPLFKRWPPNCCGHLEKVIYFILANFSDEKKRLITWQKYISTILTCWLLWMGLIFHHCRFTSYTRFCIHSQT